MNSFRSINHTMHSIRLKTRHKMIAEVERNQVEMTYIDHKMMLDIDKFGLASQQMLVESMNRDKGQIARMTNRLQKQELIEKKSNPEDKRSVQLCLTEKGHQVLQNLESVESQMLERMFADFSDDEAAVLKKLVEKIDRNLGSGDLSR
ncbi:MarR family winged helix-turn-helix transcriptional regulator [Vibrio maerlii]|uniref:MarR family winged helix-turn-helix transcriptional regulator n=1 Tax=Vibrio maerlii TaxID=2231648 RepID=UPI000E3C446E|nr:MarR family transcriptional regulator [Vibrio maerlii]